MNERDCKKAVDEIQDQVVASPDDFLGSVDLEGRLVDYDDTQLRLAVGQLGVRIPRKPLVSITVVDPSQGVVNVRVPMDVNVVVEAQVDPVSASGFVNGSVFASVVDGILTVDPKATRAPRVAWCACSECICGVCEVSDVLQHAFRDDGNFRLLVA